MEAIHHNASIFSLINRKIFLKAYIMCFTKTVEKIVNHFKVEDHSWLEMELPPIVLHKLFSQNQQSTSEWHVWISLAQPRIILLSEN